MPILIERMGSWYAPVTAKFTKFTEKTLMNSNILIKAEGVGKKFCRDLKKSLWYGAKDIVTELIPGKKDVEGN